MVASWKDYFRYSQLCKLKQEASTQVKMPGTRGSSISGAGKPKGDGQSRYVDPSEIVSSWSDSRASAPGWDSLSDAAGSSPSHDMPSSSMARLAAAINRSVEKLENGELRPCCLKSRIYCRSMHLNLLI